MNFQINIVYVFNESTDYPKHSLLLEATLADNSNQRRMEMEPVSRHLGDFLLKTKDKESYCVFVTTFLHINVLSDFRSRKYSFYFNPREPKHYVEGMKIISLDTDDLKQILLQKKHYIELYKRFDCAYQSEERNPLTWYNDYVKIKSTEQ